MRPQKTVQALLSGLPGGGVTVRTPPGDLGVTSLAVFGALTAWTLAQGLTADPASPTADVPGLQLALGLAATVYLLRDKKRVGLGKAAALALGGLLAGTAVGSAAESWLRVDVVPLFGLASPGALVSEFSLAGLWAACVFLS